MSRISHKNPNVTNPRQAPGDRDPSARMARDRSATGADPYESGKHQPAGVVCSHCGAEARGQRWVMHGDAGSARLAAGMGTAALCPACTKTAEDLPQGIVTLRGDYWRQHRAEIQNLIQNVAAEVAEVNPMARIMAVTDDDETLVVETTTEKLAQRIGRQLVRAYNGSVRYRWSGGNHLVRVDWERAANGS